MPEQLSTTIEEVLSSQDAGFVQRTLGGLVGCTLLLTGECDSRVGNQGRCSYVYAARIDAVTAVRNDDERVAEVWIFTQMVNGPGRHRHLCYRRPDGFVINKSDSAWQFYRDFTVAAVRFHVPPSL